MIQINYTHNGIPIVLFQCQGYWQEINILDLDNVHSNPIINAAFQKWRADTEEDLDPESPNYFFVPGPTLDPPPSDPDYSGFINAALMIPGFLDYLDTAGSASVAVLITAINNLREGFNADSLANTIAGWNRIVAHAAPDNTLISDLQSVATEKNIPFVFAQDGTVGVSQS